MRKTNLWPDIQPFLLLHIPLDVRLPYSVSGQKSERPTRDPARYRRRKKTWLSGQNPARPDIWCFPIGTPWLARPCARAPAGYKQQSPPEGRHPSTPPRGSCLCPGSGSWRCGCWTCQSWPSGEQYTTKMGARGSLLLCGMLIQILEKKKEKNVFINDMFKKKRERMGVLSGRWLDLLSYRIIWWTFFKLGQNLKNTFHNSKPRGGF